MSRNLSTDGRLRLALSLAVMALAAPGCDDPSRDDAVAEVIVNDLSGDLRVDLTHPDAPAFVHLDAYVGYSPKQLPPEAFGTHTAAHATLTLVHPGGEVALPILFRDVDLTADSIPADGTVSRMLLDGTDSLRVADLSAYCGVAPLSLRLTVTVDECACSGSMEIPAILVCDEDRRGDVYLALVSAPPPADRPCRADDTANAAYTGAQVFGWDAAGEHLFTDLYVGEEWVERHAFSHDDDGRLVRDVTVSPEDGEVYRTTTYTWGADGRLARVDRRNAFPPYEGSTRFYRYDDDTDWTTVDDADNPREVGVWSEAEDVLEITSDGASIAFTFDQPYARGSWLGQTDLERYHALHVATATDARGTRTWTWSGGRITSDVAETGALQKRTAWRYDACP